MANQQAGDPTFHDAFISNLAGYHSIRVNSRWRLIFRWDGSRGEAVGVYLDDHGYG